MADTRMVAIRGATTVDADRADLVADATRELLSEIVERNALDPDDIVSALFTVTDDLRSEFPARAARELGWVQVPMLCTVEIPVPGSLRRCIRVLIHVERERDRRDVSHVYLREARALRPDLARD